MLVTALSWWLYDDDSSMMLVTESLGRWLFNVKLVTKISKLSPTFITNTYIATNIYCLQDPSSTSIQAIILIILFYIRQKWLISNDSYIILYSVALSRLKPGETAYNRVWPLLGHCQETISTLVVQVESGVRHVECVPVTDNEHLCSVRLSFYKFSIF